MEQNRTTGIRCIAFDAVGTLIYPDPPVADAYADVARRYGSRLADDEVARRFRRAFHESEEHDLSEGDWRRIDRLTTNELVERERWRRIAAAVIDDVSDPERCFQELFDHFARPSAWACYSDVADTLESLKRSGYRLAIASNFDGRLNAQCDALPELRPIEVRAVSSLVGWRKPSLHFYRAVAQAANCSPAEVLMVGDDFENDVLGARRAGLHALHLRRNALPEASDQIAALNELPHRLADFA